MPSLIPLDDNSQRNLSGGVSQPIKRLIPIQDSSAPPAAPAPAKRPGKQKTVSWLGESNLPVVGQYKHPGGSQVSDVISYPAPTKENPGARVFLVPPSAKRKPSSPRDANILNAPTAQTPDFAPMVVEQGPDGSFVRRGSYRPAAAPVQQAAPAQSPAPEQPRISDLMRNRETVEQWKSRRPKEVAELERDYTTYAELKDRNPILALQFQQSAEEKYAKLQAELGSPDQFISQQRQVEMGMLTPPQLAMQGADGRTASVQSLRGSDMQGAQASELGAGVGEQAAQYDDAAARVAAQRGYVSGNAAGRTAQAFGMGVESVAAGAARLLPGADQDLLNEVSRNQASFQQAAGEQAGGVGRAVQGIAQSYGVVAPGAALGAVTGGAATGMALTAGLSQYGQAYQQATDAGLRGSDRERFATVNAAAESLMSLAFTKLLKMPGLEGAFAKGGLSAETVKGVLWKAAQTTGRSGLEELPEEFFTALVQNVNARQKVDPNRKLMTGDELFDIAVQSMGAAGGARALGIAPSIPGEISKANVIRGNAKAYVETPTGPADWAKSHPMAAEEIAAVVQEGKPVSRAMMEANSLPTMDSVKRSKWAADVHAAVVDLKAKGAVDDAAGEIAAEADATKPLKSMKKKPVAEPISQEPTQDAAQPDLAELTSPEQPAPPAHSQTEVPQAQQAEVGEPAPAPTRSLKTSRGQQISRLQQAFPNQQITADPRTPGRYNITLRNGKFISAEYTDSITPASKEAAERSMGRKLSDAEYGAFTAKGEWRVSDGSGFAINGQGLVRLAESIATDGTARHEALHAAKSMGLITDAEWAGLVQQFAPNAKTDGDAEEAIARATEAWTGPHGLAAKIKQWFNQVLSALRVVKPSGDTVMKRLRSGKVFGREGKTETRREAGSRLAGDVRYSGDTEPSLAKKERAARLANPGTSQSTRDDIDRQRLEYDDPDTRSMLEVYAAADKITPQEVRALADSGRPATDVETEAILREVDRTRYEALVSGDAAKMREAEALLAKSDAIGTEQGRALHARRDKVETPFQRNQRLLGDALLGAPLELREAIKQAEKSAYEAEKSGDRKKAREERKRAGNLSRKGRLIAERNRAFLERIGMLPKDKAGWDELAGNSVRTERVIREALAMNQPWGSAIAEYWNSSLLSGPATQVRNLLGTPLNYSFILAERALATGIKTLAFRQSPVKIAKAFAAFWNGMKQSGALSHAIRSYTQEVPTFDRMFNRENYGGLLEDMHGKYSIRGVKGRIIRGIGWGPLRAADQFWKAIIGSAEVGRHAYAQANEELGSSATPEAISSRMAELMADRGSAAWKKALEISDVATFTETGSKGRQEFKTAIKNLRNKVPGGKFIVPFVDTPINIAAQTIHRAPVLGALRFIPQMFANRRAGRPTFSGISEVAVRQLIGWAAYFAISGAFSDDEDRDFAITSGQHQDQAKRYAIKVGNKHFSYQGLEPIASLLALMADYKSSESPTAVASSVIEQIANKPMLQGLGDILRIIQPSDMAKAETKTKMIEANLANWAKNFGASWVPALYRQTINAARQDAINTRIMPEDADNPNKPKMFAKRVVEQAGLDWAFEAAGLKRPAAKRIDAWGAPQSPVIVDSSPATDFFYRLLSPVRTTEENTHPGNELLAAWNRVKPADAEDYSLPTVTPYYTDNSGKRQMFTEQQFEQFQRLAGTVAGTLYAKGKFNPANPTEEQVSMLTERLLPAASEEARRLVVQSIIDKKPVAETPEQIAERLDKKVRASLFDAAKAKVSLKKRKGELDYQRDRRVASETERRDMARETRKRLGPSQP